MRWSEDAMIAAIEDNLYDFWIKAATLSDNIARVEDQFSWVICKNSDWPNSIFKVNLSPENVTAVVGQIIGEMKEAALPPVWMVGPQSQPPSLGTVLSEKGLVNLWNQRGMAIELSDRAVEVGWSDGFEIAVLDTRERLKEWSAVSDRNFKETIDIHIREKLLGDPDVDFYAGLVAGNVVATLMSYYTGDIAGIHFVSTLPEFRKLGIGSAITKTALQRAGQRGCTLAVLQASALGFGVYRDIGFREYCTLAHYQLP